MNLQTEFKRRFPELITKARTESDEHQTTITLNFLNPRYNTWIAKDEDGFMVGINELHNHFDLGTPEENLEAAFNELTEILTEKVAAVGLTNEETNYLLATLALQQAIESYSNEKPKVEIVTFKSEH
ncbi:hypothetical protein [Roseivirga sp. E12]|uniref:hypothetical protein n=1 Tax=Roseivirga sp. E12 TaxID=2819237 RepID=UPI001ABD02F5|nr:hypothetical protein [Roseivirga sp. E12]MBO3697722.1 hypothetical protein [Roseivirga sp. E12]